MEAFTPDPWCPTCNAPECEICGWCHQCETDDEERVVQAAVRRAEAS